MPRDYMSLYRDLRDYKIAIDDNEFGLIDELHHAYYDGEYVNGLGECIHQYLVRLHKEYPAVYAITIAQFPDFEKYLDRYVDPEGYQFLAATVYKD